MRLLDLVRPINEQKKRELELQLELEKQRLNQSTDRAATQIRTSVLERRWFHEHPMETTILILLGGFCVARWADSQKLARSKAQRSSTERPRSELDLGGAHR
jgi:hypothetical protein